MQTYFSDLFRVSLSNHKGRYGKEFSPVPGQAHVIGVQIIHTEPALSRLSVGIVSSFFHTNTAVRLTLYESR